MFFKKSKKIKIENINNIFSFDLDGTLLNSKEQVLPDSIKGIKLIKKNKDLSIINTGRSLNQITDILKTTSIRYAILLNGAAAYDNLNKKSIFKNLLEKKQIDLIFQQAQKHNLIMLIDLFEQRWLIVNSKEQLATFKSKDLPSYIAWDKVIFLKSITETIKLIQESGGLLTLYYYANYQNQTKYNQLVNQLKKIFNNTLNVYTTGIKIKGDTGTTFAEISVENLNIDKATGLFALKNELKIGTVKTHAYGDSFNDFSILSQVEYPNIMSNGTASLKKAFPKNIIGSHNTDAIYQNILSFYYD